MFHFKTLAGMLDGTWTMISLLLGKMEKKFHT